MVVSISTMMTSAAHPPESSADVLLYMGDRTYRVGWYCEDTWFVFNGNGDVAAIEDAEVLLWGPLPEQSESVIKAGWEEFFHVRDH
jgi:hypothetical protein